MNQTVSPSNSNEKNAVKASHLVRLAKHISQGQVVFFIGAGFSVDSEGNTANILIARLVARFEALCKIVEESAAISSEAKREFKKLYGRLQGQFGLQPIQNSDSNTDNISSFCHSDNIEKLSKEYYQINDWFCSAFSQMLQSGKIIDDSKKCLLPCGELHRKEVEILNAYFKSVKEKKTKYAEDFDASEHLQEVKLTDYLLLSEKQRGKALFLDTMGFNDPRIMRKYTSDRRHPNQNPVQKLFPRHHLLGQWAKEGVMPVLVTSNYDLLLEGGYLGAGNALKIASNTTHPNQPAFCTVSQPNEFFVHGHGFNQSLIVKIHGCTESYRRYRAESLLTHFVNTDAQLKTSNVEKILKRLKASDLYSITTHLRALDDKQLSDLIEIAKRDCSQPCAWEKYLKSMVFTYREIQNWRADKWSQDYLQTLLRTRKMVFMGYSGQDQVIHDTIRSVYEDIAKQRQLTPSPNLGSIDSPSFFFEAGDGTSFHASEILRSAQHAVSDEFACVLSDTNKFQFHFKNQENNSFPDIDHKLRMLFHLSYRELQLKLFPQYLPRVVQQLFGKHKPSQQQQALIKKLRAFCRLEQWRLNTFREEVIKTPAEQCEKENSACQLRKKRRFEKLSKQLNNHLAWTESFHQPLMNLMHDAEQRHAQRGTTVPETLVTVKHRDQTKNIHWYTPITANPEWSAWCIVIELALRNINRVFAKQNGSANKCELIAPLTRIIPTENNRYKALHTEYGVDPTLVITQPGLRSPSYVHFRIANSARTNQPLPHSGVHACKSHIFWELAINGIPWQQQSSTHKHEPSNQPHTDKQAQPKTPTAEQLWQFATNPPKPITLESLAVILPLFLTATTKQALQKEASK